MIELNEFEIEEVSGAMNLFGFVTIGNMLLEFGTGFVDGLKAAGG